MKDGSPPCQCVRRDWPFQGATSYALVGIVLLIAFTARLGSPIDSPIENPHAFRQSHVASNIEHYAVQGLALEGELYALNMQTRVFDFPLYQWLAATLARITDLHAVAAARVLNLIILPLFLSGLALLLWTCWTPPLPALAALLFAALSPLKVYYDRAPLPDNLAVALSVAALALFMAVSARGWGRKALFGAAMMAFCASLIKAPSHFPAALAVVLWAMGRHGWRGFLRPPIVIFLASSFAGVVVYVMVSSVLNPEGSFSTSWYFGGNRLALYPYYRLGTYLLEIASEPGLVLTGVGLAAIWWAMWRRDNQYAMLLALITAWIVTVGLFYNLHVRHNYYWLPAVLPLCWAAGLGVHSIAEIAKRWHPILAPAASVVLVAVAAFAMHARTVSEGPNTIVLAESAFLRANVPKEAVLLYVNAGATWDPEPFFYAKRYGFNVEWKEISEPDAYLTDTTQTFLFIPTTRIGGHRVKDVAGWQRVVTDTTGVLFSWHLPAPPSAANSLP